MMATLPSLPADEELEEQAAETFALQLLAEMQHSGTSLFHEGAR